MSIANALFTDSQSRVFRWLLGHPERCFHLNELRRLTGLGSASLQRELNRLTDAGLLLCERIGNLRRFQANPKSPIFPELVALVAKTLGVELQVRDALLSLRPLPQAAWIYGSIAKQADTAASDVDIMIVGANLTLDKIFKVLAPVENRLARKINPICYSPEEFDRRREDPDSFVNRVLAQPNIVLIKDAAASA